MNIRNALPAAALFALAACAPEPGSRLDDREEMEARVRTVTQDAFDDCAAIPARLKACAFGEDNLCWYQTEFQRNECKEEGKTPCSTVEIEWGTKGKIDDAREVAESWVETFSEGDCSVRWNWDSCGDTDMNDGGYLTQWTLRGGAIDHATVPTSRLNCRGQEWQAKR
jgi:hypothetical protein